MTNDPRLALHTLLVDAFPHHTVYFRPPSSLNLVYPCIVYTTQKVRAIYAHDVPYLSDTVYQVSLLSKTPGHKHIEEMLLIPGSSHIQSFMVSDIVHDVFSIRTTFI